MSDPKYGNAGDIEQTMARHKREAAASPAPVGDGLVELAAEWEEWCTGPHNPFHTLLRRTQKALRESAATITRLEQRERELVEGLRRIEQFALSNHGRAGLVVELRRGIGCVDHILECEDLMDQAADTITQAIGTIIEITQIARALLKDTKP